MGQTQPQKKRPRTRVRATKTRDHRRPATNGAEGEEVGRQDQGVEAEKEVHRPGQDLPAHVFGLEEKKDKQGEKQDLGDAPQAHPGTVGQ